jgi:hypothetical protein
VGQGDWQRALTAAGEITEAWLTDEDADLSHHIDAAIEKDGHDILYAMARLASAAIELHAEATVRMFEPFFELLVPEPSASRPRRSGSLALIVSQTRQRLAGVALGS